VDVGRKRLSFKERRELEELEVRIASREERKAEVERQLAAQGSDHVLGGAALCRVPAD
jgi:hypothetical protein